MSESKYRKVIFDSSAFITTITKEKGWIEAKQYFSSGVMSTVNLLEVYKYCIGKQDMTLEESKALVKICGIDIYDFTAEQSLLASNILASNMKLGISLADSCCLALGMVTGFPIITCDKIWQKLDLGLTIIFPR